MLHPKKQDHFLPHLPTRVGTHSPTGNFGGRDFDHERQKKILRKGAVRATCCNPVHEQNSSNAQPSQACMQGLQCLYLNFSSDIMDCIHLEPLRCQNSRPDIDKVWLRGSFPTKSPNNKPYVFVKEMDDAERQRQ